MHAAARPAGARCSAAQMQSKKSNYRLQVASHNHSHSQHPQQEAAPPSTAHDPSVSKSRGLSSMSGLDISASNGVDLAAAGEWPATSTAKRQPALLLSLVSTCPGGCTGVGLDAVKHETSTTTAPPGRFPLILPLSWAYSYAAASSYCPLTSGDEPSLPLDRSLLALPLALLTLAYLMLHVTQGSHMGVMIPPNGCCCSALGVQLHIRAQSDAKYMGSILPRMLPNTVVRLPPARPLPIEGRPEHFA